MLNVELKIRGQTDLDASIPQSPTLGLSSDAVNTGTMDYDRLLHKPSIEGVELQGDKSFTDLGMAGSESIDFDHGTITAVELTAAQTAALLN